MATFANRFVSAFLLAGVLALAACGGGGGGAAAGGGGGVEAPATNGPPASQVPNLQARAHLTVSGGADVTLPGGSAVGGTRIVVPPGAAQDEALDIQVGYLDTAPGPFSADAIADEVTQVSKTLVVKVTTGASSEFNLPITITMPYDKAAAGGLPPTILYWDEEAKSYSPVSVVAVDDVAGTVTFRTSHFSSFVAVVLKKLRQQLNVDTGFRVGTDSILHQNFGSYAFGGHCAAFASISSFYYSQKNAVGLYKFAQEDADEQPVDDEVTRTALAVTYALLASKWNSVAQSVFNTPPPLTGLLMVQAMKATGKPVHLVMSGDTAAEGAHAVTVYGYDSVTQAFQIYDSNFPKNVVTLPWNVVDGFGDYSRKDGYQPGMFKHIGFASDDTYGAPAAFRRILSNWQSGKLRDAFANLQVTDEQGVAKPLVLGGNVAVRIPYVDNQSISGKFNRPAGSVNPVFLHVFENGVEKGQAGVPVAADGSFTLQFPTKLDNKVDIMLIVSESKYSRDIGFSGYGKFTVQPEGKNFFVNFGFETNDLTGWSGATSLLPQGGGGSFTPTKLAVVGVGFDPIATDIPRVVFGQHAVQVNDQDPNYHTTFVAQTATVPTTGNPQLNFKWAAVLEDPQHSDSDQPFVEVTVRNVTKGIDLYKRRFFANDPNFNGWKSYQGGQWKAIDWQSVSLAGLSQYAGDQVELRIVGADCGLGGHGGYVYLDGEE